MSQLIYLFVIFSIILLYLIDFISNYLSVRSFSPTLPPEFEGYYNAEKYAESRRYLTEKVRFAAWEDTAGLIIKLVFIMAGGFEWLDIILREHFHSEIVRGIFYIGGLALAADILSMPFEYYYTFIIEQKYGFNKMDLKTFFTDKIKGYLIGGILGGLLLGAVLYFFQTAGNLAWLYCWIFVSLFSLLVMFIAPVWIMPLFNKFTPLEDGELKNAVMEYARKIGYNIDRIFVMDGSKRTTKSNAFFTGLGNKKRIALFDTLIKDLNTSELVSVLAHEVGHYKKGHITRTLILEIAKSGVIFYLLSVVIKSQAVFEAFGMSNISIYAGLIFFSLLFSPVSFLLSIISNAISRRHENEADAFAVSTYMNKDAMITALKKLSVSHASNLTPHTLNVLLHYSHPPILERVDFIRKV